MSLNACSVGMLSKDSVNCHKLSFTRKTGLELIEDLGSEEKECLLWRSKIRELVISEEISTVCYHHKLIFLAKFTRKNMSCCNLFRIHNGKFVKGISTISLQNAKDLEIKFPDVIPGLKFCPKCTKYSQEVISSTTESSESEIELEIASEINSLNCASHSVSNVSNILDIVGSSPIKLHSLNTRKKITACKKKIVIVKKRLIADISIATNLDESFLDDDDEAETSILKSKKTKRDCSDYEMMLNALKEKFNEAQTSFDEKIQILTLMPESWSRSETRAFFGTKNCSDHAVKKAVDFKHKFGILAKPNRKPRSGITDEVKQLVRSTYEDDEMSRIMPGAKDKVSLGKNEHAQKRLLLCTVKELYNYFVAKHSEAKIKLTSFYSLKPKWCIQPGKSGTHTVCVCAIHQNVVLLCDAVNLNYKDLMSHLVCDVENKICMIHRCSDCPGINRLTNKLEEQFFELNADELIHFQQWQSTDRTQLLSLSLPLTDFIQILTEKVDHLTSHSFIAKSQASYLRSCKDTLIPSKCLILADFSENYHFIVQDAIQSCHWSNESCTIHPIVIYVLCNNTIKVLSFCYISNDLEHDTAFVYYLQSSLSKHLKDTYPHLLEVEYFSDGCAAQYKNYKNFLNLTYHYSDFGLHASWSFFATSHGKSPCDGIGGVVKRKLANESLSRPRNNQILKAKDAFLYCQENITGVNFFYAEADEVAAVRCHLQKRFQKGSTVPGTRSFHYFSSTEIGSISYKRISSDYQFAGTHSFFECTPELVIENIKVMSYIACVYDEKWWVGLVEEVDKNSNDIYVNFMHPFGPSSTFLWPTREDKCYVNISCILMTLDSPSTATGRLYSFPTENIETVKRHYNALLQKQCNKNK